MFQELKALVSGVTLNVCFTVRRGLAASPFHRVRKPRIRENLP